MVDAQDSKSCEGNFMRVRFPPAAPHDRPPDFLAGGHVVGRGENPHRGSMRERVRNGGDNVVDDSERVNAIWRR